MLRPSVTRASVANVEQGNQAVLVHTLFQIAQALGIQPIDLLPPVDAPSDTTRRAIEHELTRKLGSARTKRLVRRIFDERSGGAS